MLGDFEKKILTPNFTKFLTHKKIFVHFFTYIAI